MNDCFSIDFWVLSNFSTMVRTVSFKEKKMIIEIMKYNLKT